MLIHSCLRKAGLKANVDSSLQQKIDEKYIIIIPDKRFAPCKTTFIRTATTTFIFLSKNCCENIIGWEKQVSNNVTMLLLFKVWVDT